MINKQPIQHDVSDKAARHGKHRAERRSEIAQQRHATGGEDLRGRKTCEHENVIVGIIIDNPLRSEDVYEIRIDADKQRGDDDARSRKINESGTEIPLFRARITATAGDGQHHRAAHAYTSAHRIDERHKRICHVDGGKPVVADIVANEKAVHDGIEPRERERHHGRQHEPQKLFQHTPSCARRE